MNCLVCNNELDEDEGDICGYCFCDRMNLIRARGQPVLKLDAYYDRERAFKADTEIRLEAAQKRNDSKAAKIYEEFLKLLNS